MKKKESELQNYLRRRLLSYLKRYIKKDFRMNDVFVELYKSIKRGDMITEKQLNSVMKFLEREREFRLDTPQEIIKYFDPIMNRRTDKIGSGTLENFL